MKKIFLAALMIVSLVLIGCGGEEKAPAPETDSEDDGRATIGIITRLNASEEKYNELMQKLEKSYRPSKAHLSANYKYFDNMKELQLALQSGQIDMLSTYQSVADYMIQRNDDLEILKSDRTLSDSFCFATRRGDTIILNELNKAIKSMEKDGKLADLYKTYITEIKDGAEPPAVEIEQIDGADTIKVAVTGDLPPFDLILADGKPAGFSTAVLSEISKRIGKNIELINVDSGARATILTSKGADVVFWVSVPKDSHLIPSNVDRPAGIDLSVPYYQDSIAYVSLKEK